MFDLSALYTEDCAIRKPERADIALIMYTSGSSGQPKGTCYLSMYPNRPSPCAVESCPTTSRYIYPFLSFAGECKH